MDEIELQAEAVKVGCTLVEQQYFYNLSCVAEAAKRHVDAVHDVMAATAISTDKKHIANLRRCEMDLFVKLVEATETIPWTEGQL